jgi:hypothetical protein
VFNQKGLQPGGDFVQRLLPGNGLIIVAHPLEGPGQPVGGILVVKDVETFAAGISSAARVGLVRPHLFHAAFFHEHLQAAVLGAQYASGLESLSHDSSL